MVPELYWVRFGTSGRLAIMPHPRGNGHLASEIKFFRASGVDGLVSLLPQEEAQELGLANEGKACAQQGMAFRSFPIEDRHVPPSREEALALARQIKADLEAGRSIAIHCRMGIGRSAVIASLILLLSGLSPDRAWELLSEARGYPVPDTAEQREWVAEVSNGLPPREF